MYQLMSSFMHMPSECREKNATSQDQKDPVRSWKGKWTGNKQRRGLDDVATGDSWSRGPIWLAEMLLQCGATVVVGPAITGQLRRRGENTVGGIGPFSLTYDRRTASSAHSAPNTLYEEPFDKLPALPAGGRSPPAAPHLCLVPPSCHRPKMASRLRSDSPLPVKLSSSSAWGRFLGPLSSTSALLFFVAMMTNDFRCLTDAYELEYHVSTSRDLGQSVERVAAALEVTSSGNLTRWLRRPQTDLSPRHRPAKTPGLSALCNCCA
ncbi:hypothetical protein BD289DRAFT_161650 [Coniella lustricola]|uniref:Uncharacterized protein n=1 Tax=Coniella lustricola TaxID=2025994 RepID=A0A2T2ZUE9_9PEZI|nr:hypothetical protein BD289DRAFT_161650 [Coniella lustricola]